MRNPTHPPSSGRGRLLGPLVVGALVLFGLVLVYNGGAMLVERQTGERVPATVRDCVDSGPARARQTRCVGTWTVDGVVRIGRVQGATSDQVGKTIEVTVRGDTAYSRHLGLRLVLVGLGLVPLLLVLVLFGGSRRRRAAGGAEPA